MSTTLEVYTIGAGDLLQEVFNAIASIFNNRSSILALTHLAILLGGFSATLLFAKSRDIKVLIQWGGIYVLVTSLMLYPKCTVQVIDNSGADLKPRAVDNVPLSLGIFASMTSRIGLGMAEMVETVFHMPNDMNYNQTGMLMASKLVLSANEFQITDPDFSETLNEFMQQCVFYDILLQKYSVKDLMYSPNPWEFIKQNTSQARAFPLNGKITICKVGAGQLDQLWKDEINHAAAIYGAQILGRGQAAAKTLLSRLSDGYGFLTKVSEEGTSLLQKNLLSNAMSQAVGHYGANVNAPAALAAFEDTKTELQIRHTLDVSGRQTGFWIQQLKNILEAVLYGSFILVYFLSYFPFGLSIVRNYLFGMFYLQSLAPMYAIINFATTFYAQNRSILFSKNNSLSMAAISGITQANADAMALAGYLTLPVTLGGAYYLFRGLPAGLQSIGQYLGGVVQNSATHVAAEAIGGNLSVGNTHFANHSQFNTNANHFDTNARHASGMLSLQTLTGSTISVTPNGREVMNSQGSLSNLSVGVHVAESLRTSASSQAQTSYTAGFNQMRAAGDHYATAFRQMDDLAKQRSHFENSGSGLSETNSTGLSHSAHQVSQLINGFAKEHHISHDHSAQVLGQVYADMRVGGGIIVKGGGGISGSISESGRSSFGSLYNEAERFSKDKNFAETVDSARRDATESHYRVSDDAGNRLSQSITRSFDEGDSLRHEASSSFSRADSYSSLASQTSEKATSINENYTQEFYEWMRKQPPIYQHGATNETMSRSMIDNLSVDEMRYYGDRFSQEKAAEALTSFKQTHHLDHGQASIMQTYDHNNQSIPEKSSIESKDHAYQAVVNKSEDQVNTGSVNRNMKDKVNSKMQEDENLWKEKVNATQAAGSVIENRAREKVKGKVLGSLNVSEESLMSKMNKNTESLHD